MNAQELFTKEGKSSGIFFCGNCRQVYRNEDQELAEACCQNYKCRTCGKDTLGRSWLICDECRQAEEQAKERQRFEKAEKVTEYGDWVFDGDHFHENVDEFLEDLDGEEPPEYVWACKPTAFVKVDLDRILEDIEENAYEDFDDSTLNGLDELKAAIKKFEDANADVLSWEPDYSKAVLIKKE